MASILIMNMSFQNRGDALMTEAIHERLGPSQRWAIAADVAFVCPGETRPYRVALVSGQPGRTLKQRIFNRSVSAARAAAATLPRAVRDRSRLIMPADLDLALDVCGYSFGDPWGQDRVDQAIRTYRLLRRDGVKIVLMPRTWGPFTKINSRSLDRLFDEINLAFARDERSLGLIQAEISPANRQKLFFAPDYTHAVAPARAPAARNDKIAYLIPSSRVIDSSTLSRERYLALFASARVQLAEAGLKPKLLIHETANDMAFVAAAPQMGFVPDEVVVPGDAIAAKTLISNASAVVTSRLHGLYNALNSLVPVAVVAWSFKYEEALKQYHCPECLVDLSDLEPSLRQIIQMMTNPTSSAALKRSMVAGRKESERESERMWARIGRTANLDLNDIAEGE